MRERQLQTKYHKFVLQIALLKELLVALCKANDAKVTITKVTLSVFTGAVFMNDREWERGS